MSVELNSAQTLVDLIRSIEEVTGETHYDLTSAVQALKNGYGQGGSGGSDEKFKALIAGTLTEVTAEDLSDVTIITSYKFAHLGNLTSVVIPDNVVQLANNAFYNCPNLEYLKMPISAVIGNNTFYAASNIKHIDLTIGDGTYVDFTSSNHEYTPWYISMNSITKISIPDGTTKIGNYMFNDHKGLKAIFIPKSVTEVGISTFNGCTALVDIYYSGTQEEWAALKYPAMGNTPLTTATIHYNSTGLPEE